MKLFNKNKIFLSFILLFLACPLILYCNDIDYVLRSGDKIQLTYIDIDQNQNLIEKTDIFTLRRDGTISHAILGNLKISDLTANEAEALLFREMEKYFTNPSLSIILLEKNSINVLLYGAVNNSGIIKTTPKIRIVEFLLSEGKLKSEADLTNIQIIKDNGEKYLFNLPNYLYKNETENNISLDNGDKVIIPSYADRNFTNIVSDDYILKFGNTLKVSIYENSEGLNAEKNTDVLTLDNEGYVYHNMIGKMHIGGMTILAAEQLVQTMAATYIKDPVAQINLVSVNTRNVYIFGEVKNPGYHPLQGSVRLAEFIAKSAGGMKDDANIKKIQVTRKDGAKHLFNFEDFLFERKDNGNILLEDGDRIIVPSKNIGLSYRIANAFRRYYWILQFLTTTISLYILIETVK
ncbi:MAG: polysaccharide biosynthesis/export family protein [Candidatus Marinimicrobia bacterium]|nr:polysaccharide biosynthesis/export family protein [Candidatus Neomarinimicrobiota bacterium]